MISACWLSDICSPNGSGNLASGLHGAPEQVKTMRSFIRSVNSVTTFRIAAASSIQLSSEFMLLCVRGVNRCVQYSGVPSLEQENQAGRFCKRRTRRTEMPKGLSHTSIQRASASATSRSWHGQKRPTRTWLTSRALIRAHAGAGLPTTTSRLRTFSRSSSAKSCGATTRGNNA